MKHPVDQLFKKKLSGYNAAPSADAWEKFQAYQKNEKVRKVKTWYPRIAATILLLITASYLIMVNKINTNAVEVDLSKISKAAVTPELLTPVKPEPPLIAEAEADFTDNNVATVKTVIVRNAGPASVEEATAGVIQKPVEIPDPVKKISVRLPEKPVEELSFLKVAKQDEPTGKNEKLTLINHIVNTARDIKNSDGLFANLREFKDEVVSLEFLKTKKSI